MQEPHHTPTTYKSLLKQVLMGALALGLLWYAFKGINFQDIWAYAQNLKLLPVVLMLVSGVVGNLIRSYRWTLLLKPLKPARNQHISQFNSFYAVTIGYGVNIIAPRAGEVVRLLSICKTEELPWAGVLSTMLIDRLLDVAFLLIFFGVTLLILPPSLLVAMPWLKTGGMVLLVVVALGLTALPFMGAVFDKLLKRPWLIQHIRPQFNAKLIALASQFNLGASALKNLTLYPYIALLSACIWFSYWLNFYLMVFGFGLEDTIDALQCLVIFTIGSIGSLVPTPSSVGGFHLLVKEAAILTANIPPAQAIAFATVLHFITIILVSLLPAAALWIYQSAKSKSKS